MPGIWPEPPPGECPGGRRFVASPAVIGVLRLAALAMFLTIMFATI